MKNLNLKAICLIFALWTYAAVAAFYPINRGMVNQATYVTTQGVGNTTTAVATSNQVYVFEGTEQQYFKLPAATALPIDWWYDVINNSTQAVTVFDNSNAVIATANSGEIAKVFLKARATAAGTWKKNVNASSADLSNYYTKSEFINSSSGVSDANKPIKTDASGVLDTSLLPGGTTIAMGAFGSSPNSAGGTIASNTLTLQPADATNPGGISTTTQTIPGAKTFAADITVGGNYTFTPTVNSSLSGANARIPSHTTANMVFTNAGLTSICSANNGGVSGGHTLQVTNETGAAITLVNNCGTAAAGEAIYTGTTADVTIPNHGQFWLQYNSTASAWVSTSSRIVNLASSGVSGVLPYANGGTNASTNWTQGSVIFAGASSFAQDNAKLFFDDTNNRLGIGTASPTTRLFVKATADNYDEFPYVQGTGSSDYWGDYVAPGGAYYKRNGNSGVTPINILNGTSPGMSLLNTNAVAGKGVRIKPYNTTDVSLVIDKLTSQTGHLQDWNDTDGSTHLASIDATGNATFVDIKITNKTSGALVTDSSGNVARVSPSTSGNVLTSDGTNWVSSPVPAATGSTARFTLSGATVPFVAIDGAHYQQTTQSLTAVYISMLNSGTSGSTTIQVNQYRSGALQGSATASLSASSGNPSGASANLSGTLSLLAGDIITVDVNSVAGGSPSELSVEY